jgi:hypothetical protein
MGIQELMMHFHPLFSAIIIPLTLLIFLVFLPYFSYDSEGNGIWFHSGKGKSLAKGAIIISLTLTIAFVLIDEYILQDSLLFGIAPDLFLNGLLPFLLIITGLFYYSQYLKKIKKANKIEIIQTLFILIFSSFSILTLIGIFLRGEGMRLTFF